MFDLTSSKLLLLGIVSLLVIGPKDFPVLLRTIGKYVGIIRGHAKDFRAQFDEAMRESELADLKKDVEKLAQETKESFSSAGQSVEQTLQEAQRSIDSTLGPDPLAHDANGLPITPPQQPADAISGPPATHGIAVEADGQSGIAGAETPQPTASVPATAPAPEKSQA